MSDKKITYRSNHPLIGSMVFDSQDEADLAETMAVIATKNDIGCNEFRFMFSATLRLLKSKSEWAK